MNWLARLLIYGMITVSGLFAIRGRPDAHTTESVEATQHLPSQTNFADPVAPPDNPSVTADSDQASISISSVQPVETRPGPLANPYQAIVERNMFALHPTPCLPTPTISEPPPKEDLYLTGLCALSSVQSAVFRMAEAGQPPIYFTLAGGEQNDWLEVLSVDPTDRTVKIRLKKPVMRIRSVGVEVILALETFH